jgi:hypothetical protein
VENRIGRYAPLAATFLRLTSGSDLSAPHPDLARSTGPVTILVILCLDVAVMGSRSTGRGLETVVQAGAPQPGGSSGVPSSG